MLPRQSIRVVSYQRAGPLVPRRAGGLRAASVRLRPGAVMDWHSTRAREELLVLLSGQAVLEALPEAGPRRPAGGTRRLTLRAGRCALLPRRTLHRLVNRSNAQVRYIYVTALA